MTNYLFAVFKFRREKALVMALERKALIELYEATDGKHWKNNTHWCSDRHIYEWKGVKIDHNTGRVKKLLLKENNLMGTLPASVGTFRHVIEIDFRDNKLSGALPQELCDLKFLEGLYLTENSFTGITSSLSHKSSSSTNTLFPLI
jgi:hypothetical protein